MPAFDEIRFPPDISRGATGGPTFSTVVITTASGAEQRIALWERGRAVWDVSHALRTPAQAHELLSFFLARQGRLRGFRFKDWSDYSTDQPVPGTRFSTAPITSTTFRLQRTYSSGGQTYTRTITKPVAGTVRIYTPAGQEVSGGWTLDATTGVVTFAVAPGYVPQWRGEYDVPVRFDTDQMQMGLDDAEIRSWERIQIVEVLV